MSAAEETFKPIPSYEGLYEASNHGNIKSLPRIANDGRRVRGCIMKPSPDKFGRLEVRLTKDGKGKTRRVHQLVMEAFAGPPEPGQEVRHLDGNPANNRWAPGSEEEARAAGGNLFYGTHAENMADMSEHGTSHWAHVTKCPAGHEYTPENTMIYKSGSRACRECSRIEGLKRYHAKKTYQDPTVTCGHCGHVFERGVYQVRRKYCSPECVTAAETARREARKLLRVA